MHQVSDIFPALAVFVLCIVPVTPQFLSGGVLQRAHGPQHVAIQPHQAGPNVDVIRRVNLTDIVKDPVLEVYVPDRLEVRGSSWSTLVHGVFMRDVDVQRQIGSYKPVYRRMASPVLFLFWMADPRARWIISEQLPTPEQQQVMPLAELHTTSIVPAFSRGWFVASRGKVQEPLDNPHTSALRRPAPVSFLQLQTDPSSSMTSSGSGSFGSSSAFSSGVQLPPQQMAQKQMPLQQMPQQQMPQQQMPQQQMPQQQMPQQQMPQQQMPQQQMPQQQMPQQQMPQQQMPQQQMPFAMGSQGAPEVGGLMQPQMMQPPLAAGGVMGFNPQQGIPAVGQVLPLTATGNAEYLKGLAENILPTYLRRQDEGDEVKLKFDKDILCDEARPGTAAVYDSGNVGGGCPSPDGKGIWGVERYKVDPCLPPQKRKAVLDYELYGADNMLNGTLFSWGGYFLKRPFFTLRSPLNPQPPFGISELRGDVGFMWARGLHSRESIPEWYITRELGNLHPSQLLARWKNRQPEKGLAANWPAQELLELARQDWTLLRRQVTLIHKALYDEEETKSQRVNIITKGLKLLDTYVTVRNAPEMLNGNYYMVAEYLGYPFYRQSVEEGRSGFVMFRGFVLAADKDTWVIGATLGGTDGIKAYVEDPEARIPSHIKARWSTWSDNRWMLSPLGVFLEGG